MLREKATSITANREKAEMTVIWADGHNSLYPFYLLRAACPRATCRGGHENMGPEPDPAVWAVRPEDGPRERLTNIRPVGTYAITLVWEDGHDYGIYNWHYLRALCPCPICQAEREGRPAPVPPGNN